MRLVRVALLAVTSVLAVGCASAPPPAAPAVDARPLRVDASGILAESPVDPTLDGERLLARVADLLAASRRRSAARLIDRHPDAALHALARAAEPRSATLAFIAATHDRRYASGLPADGWEALLRDRIEHIERYAEHDQQRARVFALLREKRTGEAAEEAILTLPERSPGVKLLAIHAARLEGMTALLAREPARASAAFRRGAGLAAGARPYEEAHLRLLASEADRRAGSDAAAREAWTAAAALGARTLVRGDGGLIDPAFWERLLEVRPAGAPWPELPGHGWGSAPRRGEPGEAAIRLGAGLERLARGELRGALQDFTAAAALAPEAAIGDRARLGQAKALVRLGEVTAAQSILSALAARASAPAARPAEALLGALELRLDRPKRALALLDAAVTPPGFPEGFDREEAEANLGLACLACGREAEGLRRLHDVQARLEATGRIEEWVQCARNELRWLEHEGREEEAEGVRGRLDRIEGMAHRSP